MIWVDILAGWGQDLYPLGLIGPIIMGGARLLGWCCKQSHNCRSIGYCRTVRIVLKRNLKGSFTIFLFLVRSHILNSNEVWYWWFCPEGPKNASNSRFLGFYFVPRDLDSQRHMGPRLAAQGTLTSSAGDLDSQRQGTLTSSAKGPWLAAPMMRDLD